MAERSLHFRLQEYCDCYVDSDLEAELKGFLAGRREPVDEDDTEAALKMLGLCLMTAIERRAEKISLNENQITLVGGAQGFLATFSPHLLEEARHIVCAISGAENERRSGTISLGLRGAEVALTIESREKDGENAVYIGLPVL